MNQADGYLSLRALAAYSGLSVRTLRYRIADASHPLPHYRIGDRIVVRQSEYDAWVQQFRRSSESTARDVDALLEGLI